jgi:predicted nucleic acid-binding protein
VIRYLVDASALWHLLRTPDIREAWRTRAEAGVLHLCAPTRTEFLYSAKNSADRDQLESWLWDLCGDVVVPKTGWRWVENAQYKLTQKSQHRSGGALDLLVCATAVHHDLTVLHVDDDFVTVAGVMPELEQRDIRS